ncbi:MAG: IS110 family transposase, partial [Actinomycetota bacterium]
MGAYLGIDLHRRSLAVCLNEEGDRLWWRRFENSPENLAAVVEEAGPGPEVAIEATWGWYWAADLITDMGGTVHLGHPLAIKGYENRRVKNDL